MDWDLWSVPYDPDVIEEDALKEKCCIQVLRILITKADSEIDELEQDLIFLQSELAWIENEEWSEIVYNALTAKIDSLDTSMKSLRREDMDDVEVHLLMHTQPVERLHEILQPLLGTYFCKKDLKPTSAGLFASSFHPLKLDAGFSDEGIKSNNSRPISIKSRFDSEEQAVVQNLSSSCAYKERNYTENLELQATSVGVTVDSAVSDASKHTGDTSNTMKISGSSDSTIASGDFEEHSSIFTAELISGSSVKPMVIKTDPGEKDVDFVEDVAAEELKCPNEFNGSENADLDLCISSVLDYQEGFSNFPGNGTDDPTMKNPKEELFDFTSNETPMEELEVISQNAPERADKKDKNPRQIKKVEAALTKKENCALTLFLDQQDKKGNNPMMLQPKEEFKTKPEFETSVLAADEKFNSNLPLFHQVGITTTMIVDSSSSFITKGKKRQKYIARPGSNPELKAMKKRENDDEKLKKTKISELRSEKTEDDRSAKVFSDCDSEVVERIPCYSEMEKMRLPELRKVAKAHKLSRYSQLNKKELIQMLACRNGGN